MSTTNEGAVIGTGLVGGFLVSYGYLTGHAAISLVGVLIISVMIVDIFRRISHQKMMQKTDVPHATSHTINPPKPNIKIWGGEPTMGIVIPFREKKDIVHRLKWWMFCKVFPFEYEWIESENKKRNRRAYK